MISKWFELKEDAIKMRKLGISMTVIETKLGIPRSTLSGWFKSVAITPAQQQALIQNRRDGWRKARIKAVESHREKKTLRILEAQTEALKTLDKIELTSEILDLAFAMLYFGEGAKKDITSLGSSDPRILKFTTTVLLRNYNIQPEQLRCDLHLRMDQNGEELKSYWSKELNIPVECFRYIAYDKRTAGKPTYDHYKGVCVITCGNIAIQRKLIFMYTLFCEKVASLSMGA